MKLILVVACAFLAVAVAAPPTSEVKIVRSDYEQQPDGSYNTALETDDGTKRQEEGVLVDVVNEEGKTVKVITVRGSYSYIDPEGNTQNIVYSADQNGFQADGPSIPKNPEPSRR